MSTNTLGFPALKDGPHPQGHRREALPALGSPSESGSFASFLAAPGSW